MNASPLIYEFPGYLYFPLLQPFAFTSNSYYPLFTKVDKSYISGTCQVHQLSLSCAVMDLYLHRSGLCLHDLPCYSTPVGCALAISRPCPTSDKYETDPPPHNTLRSHTHRSNSKWGKGIFLEEDFMRRGFYCNVHGNTGDGLNENLTNLVKHTIRA